MGIRLGTFNVAVLGASLEREGIVFCRYVALGLNLVNGYQLDGDIIAGGA